MNVSVIVPTYNQRNLLRQTIRSLEQQTYPSSRSEVVVVDDGSTDGTAEMFQTLRPRCSFRYFRQENKGRAAARNAGIRRAANPLLIFLDGDTEATPTFIEEHVSAHMRNSHVIVVGRVELSPNLPRTSFVRFGLDSHDLGRYADGQGFLPSTSCDTGNLSVMKDLLEEIGLLDEDFKTYGWEDVDLGYRAAKLGIRLLYNPGALAYNNDEADVHWRRRCQQQHIASRSVAILFTKHPELRDQLAMFRDKGFISWRHDPPHILLRKLARSVMILPPALTTLEKITEMVEAHYPSPALLRPLYRWVIGTYICLGYREGLKARHG
jgi:GT2 family glycosyltransferase